MEKKKRGYLVPIGGAEEKKEEAVILERLVDLAGGKRGKIVVLPTASRLSETGERYVQLFSHMGIGNASSVAICSREEAMSCEKLDELDSATMLFLTGGKQVRLATVLGGTPISDRIRNLYKQGMHVAGTSAGAAFLSEHMIVGGRSGSTPTDKSVRLATGLGLTNRLIIDQHFLQRDRLGRLLAAIALNPYLTGIGLDEDTAIFLHPEGEFEVVGSGGVTVIDPTEMKGSTMGSEGAGKPVSLAGLRLHALAHAARYHTVTHEVSIPD